MRISTILLFAIVLLSNCNSDNSELDPAAEIAEIESYISRNNLTTQTTNSGMYYQITGSQNGVIPNPTNLAIFHFTQFLLDGTVILETEENVPAAAVPQTLFPGLAEAISLLRKGDSGTFLMPSALAFGQTGGNGIPPNTPVGFEITLLDCHPDLLSYEISQIQAYLSENNLSATSTPSGLHYVIEEPGEGDNPTANSLVTVNYKGFLLDGTIFDQSEDTPLTISLSQVIGGWQEGIPLFKKGGKGFLFIPSSQAYGQRGSGDIPANTPIAFEIELVEFE